MTAAPKDTLIMLIPMLTVLVLVIGLAGRGPPDAELRRPGIHAVGPPPLPPDQRQDVDFTLIKPARARVDRTLRWRPCAGWRPAPSAGSGLAGR